MISLFVYPPIEYLISKNCVFSHLQIERKIVGMGCYTRFEDYQNGLQKRYNLQSQNLKGYIAIQMIYRKPYPELTFIRSDNGYKMVTASMALVIIL